MARTRQAIKPLNLDSKTVAKAAKAEAERKTASKASLRKAAAAAKHAEPPIPAEHLAATSAALAAVDPAATLDRQAAEREAALATARADAEATGVTFEEMLESMGIDATGAPAAPEAKPGYDGPMVALKTARLHYVKAPNGILCNGDKLATVCGAHTREETVKALILALKLPGNPYLKLNPGQQSMNLRNKARGALKNGTLTDVEIEAAFATVTAKE